MAKGIQDLGIGLGFIYRTEIDGVTIRGVEKNTTDGVRSMRINGLVNAPIAAARSSVGTITVTSVAGAGQITAITIAGVNQIAAAITVSSSTASVVAAQIAAAINAYTPPSGDNYSAQAVGALVHVFSSPINGSAANGQTITVSVTDPSIVTATTNFTNGNSQFGVYDGVTGYRYWLDADYGSAGVPGGGTATPTSLVFAIEITEYITNRSFNCGVYSTAKTVATDAITTVERVNSISQIIATNQGGAATDRLEYINPVNFIEGDILFLRTVNSSQSLTVVDRANASVVSSPNIILTDSNDFVVTNNKVLMLRYTFDVGLGGVFVEMSRSISGGIVILTRAQLLTLISGNQVQPGQTYFVTDVGAGGLMLKGVTDSAVSLEGQQVVINPDYQNLSGDFAGTWYPSMPAPTAAKLYAYNGLMYSSNTGVVGTAPDTDAVNWTLVALTDPRYVREVDFVLYDLQNNYITERRDKRNNVVRQSYANFLALANDAIALFQWGNDACTGNTVEDSIFRCVNWPGNCSENRIEKSTLFDPVEGAGYSMTKNTVVNSNIGASDYASFTSNTLTDCTLSSNDGTGFTGNNLIRSTVSNNATTVIQNCTGIIEINGNSACGITLVTGLNKISGTNTINSNTNVDIEDVTGDLFFINSNTNIVVKFNMKMYNAYIQNNTNTVAGNKASCGIWQLTMENEAKIQNITWNTRGLILRGVMRGNYAIINNVLVDSAVTVGAGTVEGSARTLVQYSAAPYYLLDMFTLEDYGIDGNGTTQSLYGLNPALSNVSVLGNIQGGYGGGASNSFYAFVDASTAISAGVLTIPRYACHAARLYFYNCNGQTFNTVNFAYTGLNENYKGPLRFIRMSGAGNLICTITAVGVAAGNQIVADVAGPITLARINDFVDIQKNGSVYTLVNSKVVI